MDWMRFIKELDVAGRVRVERARLSLDDGKLVFIAKEFDRYRLFTFAANGIMLPSLIRY